MLQRVLEEAAALEQVITSVHRPALMRLLPLRHGVALDDEDRDWGVRTCGFDDARWREVDGRPGPDEIGIIDAGSIGLCHRELAPRIAAVVPPRDGVGAASVHAASVAAVLAAQRGEVAPGARDMDGCCSARLRVYQAWSADGTFDYPAFHAALYDIAARRLPVVNMSFSGQEDDPCIREAIARCVDAGVVLVAASGEGGSSAAAYPAAYDGVIGVAATDRSDRVIGSSGRGSHVDLAAPGESIWTVSGNSELAYTWVDGTSVATPHVTAAVWLARRVRPALTRHDVLALLRASVARHTVPDDGWNTSIGHGRLDVRRMYEKLPPV